MNHPFFEFNQETWDYNEGLCFTFYDVTLKVPMGDYPVGTKFVAADINYEDNTVTFHEYDNDNYLSPIASFNFSYSITPCNSG